MNRKIKGMIVCFLLVLALAGCNPASSSETMESDVQTAKVETEPTATATPEPTATATPEPTATATPEPTATATPEPTATATPEPTATATPEPTATATPEPTATATPEPTATATPEPTATATPEPTPTAMPRPTATPTPKVAISGEQRIKPLGLKEILASDANVMQYIYHHGNVNEAYVFEKIADATGGILKTYNEGESTYAFGFIGEENNEHSYVVEENGKIGYIRSQMMIPIVQTPVAETGSVSWTGKGEVLDTLGIAIPTLSEFNWQALKGCLLGVGESDHWTGDASDTESLQTLADTLNAVRDALAEAGVINPRTTQAFFVNYYQISYDWASYSAVHDFALNRDPHHTGKYTLEFCVDLNEDIFGIHDLAPYNRDILLVLCSMISSTPRELYNYIYNDLYVDSSNSSITKYVAVGDCALRFAGEESSYHSGSGTYTFVYDIIQNPTEKVEFEVSKTALALPGEDKVSLPRAYMELPRLQGFNRQALQENAGWFGDINDSGYAALQDMTLSNLGVLAGKLQIFDYLDESGAGFVISDKELKWYWDSTKEGPDLIIERVPEKDVYRITVNCNPHKDTQANYLDRARYTREILMAMLSMVTATPEDILNHMYLGIAWDSERKNKEYETIGDCQIRYVEGNSANFHWVYEIKAK